MLRIALTDQQAINVQGVGDALHAWRVIPNAP
jgi:hypothetical protein